MSATLRVRNVERSEQFYRDRLGFPVIDSSPENGCSTVSALGFPVVLVDMRSGNYESDHSWVNAGETVFVIENRLDERRAALLADEDQDLDLRWVIRPWGDRMLTVRDPDGYQVRFVEIGTWNSARIRYWYEAGIDYLRDAVSLLPDDGFDWRMTPESWSIRQVVHHVTDMETMTLPVVLAALAEPGRAYSSNAFAPALWVERLGYDNRPVSVSLTLFETQRRQMLGLLDQYDNPWTRTVETSKSEFQSVAQLLQMLASHGLEHAEDIRTIREYYQGVPSKGDGYTTTAPHDREGPSDDE